MSSEAQKKKKPSLFRMMVSEFVPRSCYCVEILIVTFIVKMVLVFRDLKGFQYHFLEI